MINSNFGFTPLREVWLGDCYPENFYDHLPNEVADPFRQISQWTKHDLSMVQKFLESKNIVVRRPTFNDIENYINDDGILAKPPITPRDDYLVLGQSLYSLHNKLKIDPWHSVIEEYKNLGYDVQSPINTSINCITPPSVVRIGRDLYIDTETHSQVWKFICEQAVNWGKNYRVNICNTYGHSDGVFCPLKPGLIASTHYKTNYNQSFPDWELLKIPNVLQNFGHYRDWHVSDNVDNNAAFSNHILQKAQDWVGNFKETVYEVNMLVIDESNVICMKEYAPLFKQFEQHGITPHVFDFRCRSFWDGGWHCLTLDIHREDTKEDLLPQRGENGVYWRIE